MCIGFAMPLVLFAPSLLGSFLTTVITKAAVMGFPLSFGALRLVPYFKDKVRH
jgi:hypothetical protein